MIGVKICGVCRPDDAAAAASAGATYVGVVVGAPSPRWQAESAARAIFSAAAGARRVGVFADADVDDVLHLADRLRLDVVQLHGSEPADIVARVAAAGAWRIWKAVRPRRAADLDAARAEWSDRVDALLIDGAAPHALGGAGVRAPWHVLAPARWSEGPAFVLAGGLNPGNVAAAVAALRPDIVDVSSGVEASVGIKDSMLIDAFVKAVRAVRVAAAEPGGT